MQFRNKRPSTVLDIGCGEGWLCRALADKGMKVWGVDAIPELITAATIKRKCGICRIYLPGYYCRFFSTFAII